MKNTFNVIFLLTISIKRINDNHRMIIDVRIYVEKVKPIDRMKERKRPKEEKSKMKNVKKTGVHLLETVNDVQTLKEKLDVMSKKYSDMVDDNKRLLLNLKQSEKKVVLLLREKEQFQSERNKALLTRKRLENLCRELQKQNKTVKEECLSRLKKEEEKRKELSDNCKSILAHINQQMNLTHEKNEKMQEESLEMNKLFKSLCDQVAFKEQQLMQEHLRTKNELYVACNKLEEYKIEATVEKEVFLREKQQLLLTINEYRTRIDELQAAEAAMKTQLDLYTNKYDEFQNCLKRSNKVCGEFNEEMERMSKKILTLEKETSLWKQRWEQSNTVFVDMAAQKQARDLELKKLKEKLALLQNLCRIFQQEKKSLVAQLNEKNAKTNNDSTTRESSKNSKSKEKDHSKKESSESNKSKEKDDHSKKESTSLENINEQLAPTNVLVSLEKRLETESNTNSTTEKKHEINEDEEITNSSIHKCLLSSEPCSEDTDSSYSSSQENRIEGQEKISSDVEMVEENSLQTQPSIAESSSVISTENINENEVVEMENKESIERISDLLCDNSTELESSSESTVNESTVQISISKKEAVQTEQDTESSNQENSTEKLIDNIENKCTDVDLSEIEAETTIEQWATDLSEEDVIDKSLELSNDELEIKLDDKLEEMNISVENIQEIEKPESEIVKDSTEVNPSLEKKVKTDMPCSKEDKSTKQNVTTATKNVRRKKK
ncbi:alpha-taxilin isoform X2 [Polistes fuscatus]|uniref:alpha-taxilin isoform X2 n=1 Tax=Polistes fuscatus TaxID=30207 RepID=UPI001CA9C3C3|nr:alpha-taxilin isoform X2 [Polistes fuscatus]